MFTFIPKIIMSQEFCIDSILHPWNVFLWGSTTISGKIEAFYRRSPKYVARHKSMYPKLKPLSVDFVDEREAVFISKWGVLETSLRSAFEFCIISATCASGCSVSNYRDVSSLWHSLLLTSQVTSGPFHFWPSDRSLDELSYQTLELFKPSSLWNGRPPLCHKWTPGGSSTKSGSGSPQQSTSSLTISISMGT